MNAITIENLTKKYENTVAVDNLNLSIKQGELFALLGGNGAGKTTFLESVCGIRKNDGIMELNGVSYTYKKRIGMIFMVMQDVNHQLFTETVLDELLISQPEENKEEVNKILTEVGLASLANRHPMSLSGGQKQRVALACAIASKLPIMLLDEPTSGLGCAQMLVIADILNKLKEEGRTIITVTHDSEFIKHCCDDVIRMEEA